MDTLALLRTLGGLGLVLGLLAGALWIVRRYDLALPGRIATRPGDKRVAIVERIALDARRSVVLLRRDDREHLFLMMPDGATILESRIVRDAQGKTVARMV